MAFSDLPILVLHKIFTFLQGDDLQSLAVHPTLAHALKSFVIINPVENVKHPLGDIAVLKLAKSGMVHHTTLALMAYPPKMSKFAHWRTFQLSTQEQRVVKVIMELDSRHRSECSSGIREADRDIYPYSVLCAWTHENFELAQSQVTLTFATESQDGKQTSETFYINLRTPILGMSMLCGNNVFYCLDRLYPSYLKKRVVELMEFNTKTAQRSKTNITLDQNQEDDLIIKTPHGTRTTPLFRIQDLYSMWVNDQDVLFFLVGLYRSQFFKVLSWNMKDLKSPMKTILTVYTDAVRPKDGNTWLKMEASPDFPFL